MVIGQSTILKSEKLLSYATLQQSLGLESVRDVEDLIIEGISSGIVTGKLDQKNSCFEVHTDVDKRLYSHFFIFDSVFCLRRVFVDLTF